jgi:hypothetical protein
MLVVRSDPARGRGNAQYAPNTNVIRVMSRKTHDVPGTRGAMVEWGELTESATQEATMGERCTLGIDQMFAD